MAPRPASGASGPPGRDELTETALRTQELERVAQAWGVETDYVDGLQVRRRPSAPALAAILRALGADPADPDAAIQRATDRPWLRVVEPVTVAWDERAAAVDVHLPERGAQGPATVTLEAEGHAATTWHLDLDTLSATARRRVAGRPYVRKAVALPPGLAWGYHRLTVAAAGVQAATWVIRAPTRAEPLPRRGLGLFVPLYALRTARDWGVGDLTDLAAMASLAAAHGATLLGTLPLLAVFLDRPHEPGPYSPITRLWWNEVYLDVTRPPEFAASPHAQQLWENPRFQADLRALRSDRLVHYRETARLKRRVLAAMLADLPSAAPRRHQAFQAYRHQHPDLDAFATFRARCEVHGTGWQGWPPDASAPPEDAVAYHAYAQWLMTEQLQSCQDATKRGAPGLYLDFPLGVHGGGFDAYRYPTAFAQGMAAGAPPDALFTGGQNWGFPPPHPEHQREDGYAYLARALRTHMERASAVRLDHAMAIHRLYWVPPGHSATDGAYVHYPAHEIYAVLCLESRRARTPLIGEDLGTVPDGVRQALDLHGIHRMHVLELEASDQSPPLVAPDSHSIACLNTHDMATWASHWDGLDIEDRLHHRQVGPDAAHVETAARAMTRQAVSQHLRALDLAPQGSAALTARQARDGCLRWLARSSAPLLMVNVEDLWLETEPQNRPGQGDERMNWRRRARVTLEDAAADADIRKLLQALAADRQEAPSR